MKQSLPLRRQSLEVPIKKALASRVSSPSPPTSSSLPSRSRPCWWEDVSGGTLPWSTTPFGCSFFALLHLDSGKLHGPVKNNVSFTKRLSQRFASPKVGRIKTVNKASEWSFHIVYSSQALAWSQNGILMEKLSSHRADYIVYWQAHSREWSTIGELILCTNKELIVLMTQ